MRVVGDEVEHEGAVHAGHGAQKEEEQRQLLVPRKFTDLDIVEEESDVVPTHVGTQAESDKEDEPDEVGPYVPCLGVKSEHALETAAEGVHGRTVTVVEVLVVSEPVGEFVERDGGPRPVRHLLYLRLHVWEQA